MKYLLSCSRRRDKIWARPDLEEAILASHFCWIAGSTMQKSTQGLLQSLLYQVLKADPSLVPTACVVQWRSGSSLSLWYEKELWDCLYAAVSASDKQLYFFVDGLDELLPESNHVLLAKALTRLSSYPNVKIVVSSRPWIAFERNLKHDRRVLTMEKNNQLAISRYVQGELNKNATDERFTQVSWDCIYKGSCESKSDHTDAHRLVHSIINKANGVFLWAALVMEAVGRHVALGCPVPVLNTYVKKLPTGLEEYFQSMVFKRIHQSMLSETAMALSIALLPRSPLSHFVLLCNYMDTGLSWLTDPEFVSNLPCTTTTSDELAVTIRKTLTFLRGCCRDILDCQSPTPSKHFSQWCDFLDYSPITFVHRTVFDYLHMPEMQLLLSEHTPEHFKDALFSTNLDVAACKTVVIDPDDLACPIEGWSQLEKCVPLLPGWNSAEKGNAGSLCSHKALELAQILDEVSLYHVRAFEKILTTTTSDSNAEYRQHYTDLSINLATHGLFAFTDALMDVAPHLLMSSSEPCFTIKSILNQDGDHDRVFDVRILRRLLQGGLDPNLDCSKYHEEDFDTPWKSFLQLLARSIFVFLPQNKQLVAISNEWEPKESRDAIFVATREEVYMNTDVQEAIKTFVEFGAELQPKDIRSLTERLPKPDGHSFDWPKFLHNYSQPSKRKETEENRKKRLLKWSEDWLTRDEWRLLYTTPDLCEEWWSDRVRRLLGFA
jgi:hypothetical protein